MEALRDEGPPTSPRVTGSFRMASSGSMYDPNDVPDSISGARDDAPMEMKPLPANVPHGDHEEGSPAPASRTSAISASRTLDKADPRRAKLNSGSFGFGCEDAAAHAPTGNPGPHSSPCGGCTTATVNDGC